MDVYVQQDVQDPDTGAIKKEWLYSRTISCYARGVITSGGARASDVQTMSNRYTNKESIEIRSYENVTLREKVTNIRDSSDRVIWAELNYPTETPTVFEIIATTPITDPFGGILGYNCSARRSENQVIGL